MTVELDEATMQRLRDEGGTPDPLFEQARVCAHCATPLARRPGERRGRWEARETCNQSCYASTRRVNERPPAEKPCAQCTGTMRQRVGEREHRWAARQCCSVECANEHRKVVKVCGREGCDRQVKKNERTYCGRDCRGLDRRNAGGDSRRAGQVRERERRARQNRTGERVPRTAPQPAPAPVAAPKPVGPPALPWRPAGWTARPNVWAGHKPYSDEVA